MRLGFWLDAIGCSAVMILLTAALDLWPATLMWGVSLGFAFWRLSVHSREPRP